MLMSLKSNRGRMYLKNNSLSGFSDTDVCRFLAQRWKRIEGRTKSSKNLRKMFGFGEER